MTGVQLFVRELQQRGVSFIATLCGHGLNPFDAACREVGLRLVDVRNEQAAGYMAEAYGRLSRRVGVCAVSSGVAHANAMTGVVNAYFDGAPVLLVTGSGPTHTMGLGHFQDIDQVALAAPVCRYARVIDRLERIPQFVHEAFTAAMSGRPGPVHLTFPLDIQTADVDPDQAVRVVLPSTTGVIPTGGDPERIAEAAQLIGDAERPFLIAGSGVYYAEGEEALTAFVKTQAIPVVVPIWDRGSVPQPIDEFMGVIGAATGGPRLLADADVVLLAGAACDYRVGYLQPPVIREDARIIRIDRDPGRVEQGVGAHLPILGDPRSVLRQLTDACARQGARAHTAWLHEAQACRKAFRERCLDARNRAAPGLHALDIIRAVQSVMTDDTVVIIDGGNIGQWVHQILCDRYPGQWLTCGAGGVVGNGLPAAMAARLLYPHRPIVLISGDGALTFTIAELE
ncbi:MAG: thiamine pyrophosphate-binding protein, partial [Candidatus Latescibacteria bacterium]|nr:thiamine pyrophosphate-binding protein [Candidatus Latescibacterota bacterium]